MKKLLQKIKTWFVLRWKEFQSIQRDKKAMKTEREVRKVEFSKKHPVYIIVTRIIAVLAAMAVAIGFTVVSCRTMKDIQKQPTVTASAEETPATIAGDLPLPQYLYFTPYFEGICWYNSYIGDIATTINLPTFRLNTSTLLIDASYTISDYRGTSSGIDTVWYNNLDSFHPYVDNDLTGYCYTESFLTDGAVDFSLRSQNGTRDFRRIEMSYYYDLTPSEEKTVTVLIRIVCGDGDNDYIWTLPRSNGTTLDGLYLNFTHIIPYYTYYLGAYDSYYLLWNDGYNYGKSLSSGAYSDGYNTGYNDGYSVGDSAGYNRGLSESLADVTPWEVIVDGVNHFFGLSILGNSVTIGMIISVGFGCILIGFAIKIFLGG